MDPWPPSLSTPFSNFSLLIEKKFLSPQHCNLHILSSVGQSNSSIKINYLEDYRLYIARSKSLNALEVSKLLPPTPNNNNAYNPAQRSHCYTHRGKKKNLRVEFVPLAPIFKVFLEIFAQRLCIPAAFISICFANIFRCC